MKMVKEKNRASQVSHRHGVTTAARTAYLIQEIKIFYDFQLPVAEPSLNQQRDLEKIGKK